MNETNLKKAVVAAMEDGGVLEKFAEVIAKKVMREKTKTKNLEEKLVKRHVVFTDDLTKGHFMIAAQVAERMYEDLGIEEDISTRKLGKGLLRDAMEVKQTARGRAYLISGIVEDISAIGNAIQEETERGKKELAELSDSISSVVKPYSPEEEDTGPDTVVNMHESSLKSELVIDEYDKEADELPKPTPEQAFGTEKEEDAKEAFAGPSIIPNESAEEITNKFDTAQEYEEYLDGLKKKKLKKNIKGMQMDIDVEDRKRSDIIDDIIDAIEDSFEEGDEFDEHDLTDIKPKKKKKKKKKKNKGGHD